MSGGGAGDERGARGFNPARAEPLGLYSPIYSIPNTNWPRGAAGRAGVPAGPNAGSGPTQTQPQPGPVATRVSYTLHARHAGCRHILPARGTLSARRSCTGHTLCDTGGNTQCDASGAPTATAAQKSVGRAGATTPQPFRPRRFFLAIFARPAAQQLLRQRLRWWGCWHSNRGIRINSRDPGPGGYPRPQAQAPGPCPPVPSAQGPRTSCCY
jgi:hypothetical protein